MNLPIRPDVPLCHRSPDCQHVTGKWPECAKDPDALHPMYAAEQVCTLALARHINMHRQQHNVYSDLCTALDAVEYGLGLPDNPDEAVRFFDYAQDILQDIPERTKVPNQIIAAHLGELFLPAYRARYSNQPLISRDVAHIHRGIAGMLHSFDDDFSKRRLDHLGGLKTELVVLALFSRIGQFDWLAYPATPREEHSRVVAFNHDSYVMLDGVKVPIQAKRKTGRKYDRTVAVVRFADILKRVNRLQGRTSVQHWGNKRRITHPREPLNYEDFTNLLIREVHGPHLSEHENRLLTVGSMAAAAEVMEKYQILRNGNIPVAA